MLHHNNILSFVLFLAISFHIHNVHSLGVQFTYPPGGATLSAEQEINFRWQDGGGSPNMADCTFYMLQLVVGGNSPTNSQVVQQIQPNGTVKNGSVTQTIPANVAQSIQNGFYLKMTSNTTEGNQVENYSNRFTIVNLNGTTDSQYLEAANAAAGNDANVPNAQYNVITLPTSSSASASATRTATVTQTSTSSSATSSSGPGPGPGHDGLSGGIIAGIVTVTVLALIGIISIIVWATFLYRRVKRKRHSDDSIDLKSIEEQQEDNSANKAFVDDKAELPGRAVSQSRRPVEMEAHNPNIRHEVLGSQPAVEIGEREPSIYEMEGSVTFHELATRQSKAYDPLS